MSSPIPTIDYEDTARWYIDKADEWANRDNVERETRSHMVDYHLRLADIHAKLATARAVRDVHELLTREREDRR